MAQNFLRSVLLLTKKVLVIGLKTTINVAGVARHELVKQIRAYNMMEERKMQLEAYRKIAETASKNKIMKEALKPMPKKPETLLDKLTKQQEKQRDTKLVKPIPETQKEKIMKTQSLIDKILDESTKLDMKKEKKTTKVDKIKPDRKK